MGTDHDTAAFAVTTIARWWQAVGQPAYPAAAGLLICADGGGSNGYRTRLWKTERYGIQPKNARPGLVPGWCKGKAHDADHLSYAGRRILVSRKWSGKTLADHRADRKDWLLRTLGVPATDPARYAWEPVAPGNPDHLDHARRMLHAVADRARWQAALTEAQMPSPESCRQWFGNGEGSVMTTNPKAGTPGAEGADTYTERAIPGPEPSQDSCTFRPM